MPLNAVEVISKIEKVDVLRALEDIAAFGIPTRRTSRKFCLEHGTQHYPPKYVISAASAFTFSDTDELERQLDPEEFAGGEQSNSRLRELGFNVISCTCGGQSRHTGTLIKETEKNAFSVTRLVVDGEAALTPKKAATALKAVLKAMVRDGEHSDVLITPGGFVSLDMERADYAVGWDTPKNELQKLVRNVQPSLEPLLSQIVSDDNRAAADFLTLGIDVSLRSEHHAELVATIEMKSGQVLAWTGKSHPTQHQEHSLMHVTDLSSHIQDINGHSVLVLGCHDLNMFSTKYGDSRPRRYAREAR